MVDVPALESYPARTHDKIRYGDTDRQGHVNNAVFGTLVETGRVEMIFQDDGPIADQGASFVIARLVLDYLGEITWPGRVDIGSRVTRVGTSSATLAHGLFQRGRPVARAETVIVQINEATRSSQPLSERAVERLSAFS